MRVRRDERGASEHARRARGALGPALAVGARVGARLFRGDDERRRRAVRGGDGVAARDAGLERRCVVARRVQRGAEACEGVERPGHHLRRGAEVQKRLVRLVVVARQPVHGQRRLVVAHAEARVRQQANLGFDGLKVVRGARLEDAARRGLVRLLWPAEPGLEDVSHALARVDHVCVQARHAALERGDDARVQQFRVVPADFGLVFGGEGAEAVEGWLCGKDQIRRRLGRVDGQEPGADGRGAGERRRGQRLLGLGQRGAGVGLLLGDVVEDQNVPRHRALVVAAVAEARRGVVRRSELLESRAHARRLGGRDDEHDDGGALEGIVLRMS
mmetsp:Transcript_12772/g.44134  ORF Transcript_12772/g.44134 Transcript_12772/m.44134 type:complete len:330 (-) Transcript_12772:462-1451(-)